MAKVKSEPINWGWPRPFSQTLVFPTSYASKSAGFPSQDLGQLPRIAGFNTVHWVFHICGQDVELGQREIEPARI